MYAEINFFYVMLLMMSFLTGVIVKITDEIIDNKIKKLKIISYFSAISYGILIGFAIGKYQQIAPVWIGIIIGVVLAKKIDAIQHILGIISAMLVIFSLRVENLDYALIILFSIASFADEKLNDFSKRYKNKNQFSNLFQYRIFVELSALTISIITNIWVIFLSVVLFDLGYMIIGWVIKKIKLNFA